MAFRLARFGEVASDGVSKAAGGAPPPVPGADNVAVY